MGSFVFKWQHPAHEVYVTGTFDDWAKSVKLENKGEHFEKLVELPSSNEKIFYKVYYPTAAPFFQFEKIRRIHKARIDFSVRHCTASPHYYFTQSGGCANFFRCFTSLNTSAKGLLGDKATLLTSDFSSSLSSEFAKTNSYYLYFGVNDLVQLAFLLSTFADRCCVQVCR